MHRLKWSAACAKFDPRGASSEACTHKAWLIYACTETLPNNLCSRFNYLCCFDYVLGIMRWKSPCYHI
jgi:hypothetical protein